MVFQDQRHKNFSPPSSLPLLFPQTKKDLRKSCETHLKKPTFMYLMPPLWLIEQGDGLSRIFNPNKTWVKNEPLPLYKEIDAVNLIFHEGELHALAQYSGYEIGHFKWLVVHKE